MNRIWLWLARWRGTACATGPTADALRGMPLMTTALTAALIAWVLVPAHPTLPDSPSPRAVASRHSAGLKSEVTAEVAGLEPVQGRRLVSSKDTINGEAITDAAVLQRIEQAAAALPAHLLADHQPGAQVRYLAHSFGSDDDAAVAYGVFREPAAALAFGCALDDHLNRPCKLVEPAAGRAYEDVPGVRCTPMGLALGAPAYEPDRCEPAG